MKLLQKRGISQTTICGRCSAGVEESIIHCVRDCNSPRAMWQQLGLGSALFFQPDDFQTWQQQQTDGDHFSVFLAGVWQAWCARNSNCLGGEDPPIHKIIRQVKSMASAIELGLKARAHHVRHQWMVTWDPSRAQVMVLNVDGSSFGNPGPVVFDGLLRTGDGEWRGGFYCSIGIAYNLQAELAALFFGLSAAWDEGVRRLICYSDSQLALELASAPVTAWHRDAALIWSIHELLARDWEVQMVHTLCEGNGSADILAKIGANQSERLTVLTSPPVALSGWLSADAWRVPHVTD